MKTVLLLIVLGCVACATADQPDSAQQQAPGTTSTTVSFTTTTLGVESTTTSVPSVVDRIVLDRTEAATAARMQADVAYLKDVGPREAGTDAEAETALWLTDSLRAHGLAVTVEQVPLPNGRESSNVIARIGRGPRTVVVGAHMDTIRDSPGIDDNGSGVVILRELARRLSETPPDVTVTLVFFGAEEVLDGYPRDVHHHGSRQMASRLAGEGALPDAMISVDMVGVGDRLLSVTYRDTDPAAADTLADIAADLEIDVGRQSRGDISDHEGFARQGVPAVMLWRPDNPAYHSPEDDEVRTDALLEILIIVESYLATQ